MTDQKHISNPNPGSNEAIALNCCCPILDNSHGLGAYGGAAKNKDGLPAFWIHPNCPLHGCQMDSNHHGSK